MDPNVWVFLLLGVAIGAVSAGVVHSIVEIRAEARRAEDRLRVRSVAKAAEPKSVLSRTFTDEGRFNWIVHNEYHLSLWLIDEWLQYWPTKEKWRWHARTYTGDVTTFVKEQLELHQSGGSHAQET